MTFIGMNAKTGRTLTESEHIKQSIKDILLTPVGSRVERRDYGSLFFHLIDQPNLRSTQLKLMSATVLALTQWEPRIKLDSVKFEPNAEKLTLSLTYSLNAQLSQKQSLNIEV